MTVSPSLVAKIPDGCSGYAYVEMYVLLAKQAAYHLATALGFTQVAYRGLETGLHTVCLYVMKNGDAVFVLTSGLRAPGTHTLPTTTAITVLEKMVYREIHSHVMLHGDSVKDVAFHVASAESVYRHAVDHGATAVLPPTVVKDGNGSMVLAKLQLFDDTIHTLVQQVDYTGPFLPGFSACSGGVGMAVPSAPIPVQHIDHCVQNHNWHQMLTACETYARTLGFHQFWQVDQDQVLTEFLALRLIVMASEDEAIKMPINEPAVGRCKLQIEEFLDFYNGSGVQHVALNTNDIVTTVRSMRARGVDFILVPDAYYERLTRRLATAGVRIEEDMAELQQLGILVDFDRHGYLLQLFTQPLFDRPTFFFEVIQRHNHEGFGEGNFKALFESIEQEQARRGTL